MEAQEIYSILGMIAGVAMPFFNIPLIIRIWRRRSSRDISLSWALGVWISIVLMTPSAVMSTDMVFKVFGIVNIVFFSGVMVAVVRFRRR